MRLLTKKERGLFFWGDAIAIINTTKNNHDMIKIDVPMKNFFICDYGVYMTDTETEYRLNKQPLSFFRSHGETLPPEIVANVKQFYEKKEFTKCLNELEKVYPEILRGKKYNFIYDALLDIVDAKNHYAIDLDTEKYIPFMNSYKPKAIKQLYEAAHDGRIEIEKLSPTGMKKAMPIAIMLIAGIVLIVVIQNVPKWIRELSSYINNPTAPPPVEPAQFILGLQSIIHHFF